MSEIYKVFDNSGLTALTDHMKVTRTKANSNEAAIETLGEDLAGLSEEVVTALGNKQDKLTFDSTPTSGSVNPVTSTGVKTYVDNNFAAKTHTHSEYLTSYTETDPTVPAWAKAASKPSYTYSEVGAAAEGLVKISNTEPTDEVTEIWINTAEEWDDNIADPTDEQVTTAVNAWLDEHPEATTTVVDGSLEYIKLKNTKVLKDYFDVSTVAAGYINNGSYTAQTNDDLGTAYYKSSDYIEWVGDVTHFTIRTVYVAVRGVHFYDKNKTFLSEATISRTGTFKKELLYVAEVPENAKYMRFDTTEPGGDTWADGIVVWPDSTIPADITERFLIDERVDVSRNVRTVDGSCIIDKTVSGEKLQNQSIGSRKIVEVSPESIIGCDFVNLFNKNLYDLAGGVSTFYIRGAWLNTDGGFGSYGGLGGALQSWVTLFIPCYPNKSYSLYRLSDTGEVLTDWFGPRVAFWDDAGENPVGVISENLTSFTTPDGAYYICVTLAVNDAANQQKYIDRIMLVEGSDTVSSYYPYAVTPYWVNMSKMLLGTSVICYGDSLTQGKYPSKVADILGVSVTDAGVGGDTCNSITARVGNYGTDFDVVTLMVGTNDNGGQTSCPWGTADDEAATDENATATETTYAARLKRLLNKIKSTHRGATFVIMPPFEHTWSNYEGLVTLMEEIARQYKMPFLDIYHLCGWDGTDAEDAAMFMADGTHENDLGAQRIAELLAGFIKQLKGA